MQRDPSHEEPTIEAPALESEPDVESESAVEAQTPGEVAAVQAAGARAAAEPSTDSDQGSPSPPLPDYYAAGVTATALTAALAAVLTSTFGLQGTIVGAVIGAVTASVASQYLKRQLSRIEDRVLRAFQAAGQLPWADPIRLVRQGWRGLVGLAQRVPRATLVSVLALSSGGFLLGMLALTLFEASKGQPVSAITAGELQSGTTVGNIVLEVVADLPEEVEAPSTVPPTVAEQEPALVITPPGLASADTAPSPSPESGQPMPEPTASSAVETPLSLATASPEAGPSPAPSPVVVVTLTRTVATVTATPTASRTATLSSASPSAGPSGRQPATATPSPTTTPTPTVTPFRLTIELPPLILTEVPFELPAEVPLEIPAAPPTGAP